MAPPGLFGNQCLWIQGIVGVTGGCDLPLYNHIFLSDWEGQILDLEREAILLFPWVEKDIMSPLITVNSCIWRGLDFDFHHLISFCSLIPTKGHYSPHCTDEETRVLWFAHDRKLPEPGLAHQHVLKSSDILFHLQPCFWLPWASRASSGSVCTNSEAIWCGRHPDHLGNGTLWGLACLLLRPQQRGCCGLWGQQTVPGPSEELGGSGAVVL